MSNNKAQNWIPLEEWGGGMDEFKLPFTGELAGKKLVFHFSAGDLVAEYKFGTGNTLTWAILEGPQKGQAGTEEYTAIQVADKIFFVDFVQRDQPDRSVSIVLDRKTSAATFLYARAPLKKDALDQGFMQKLGSGLDLSKINVEVLHATLKLPSPGKKVLIHPKTNELVGKRIKYTYSGRHIYEHIYLNDRFYTWHCLVGAEKGLADTEICDYYKIADNLYLFTWREKVMPTFGVVLIDLNAMRSNGKTFGLDVVSGKIINFPMGARAELLNETHY